MPIRRYIKKSKPDPDFSYNGITGSWWRDQASNRSHQRAYKNIADFIGDSLPRSPKLIVDYACGAGDLLSLLSLRFTKSRLIGLDGSSLLLNLAEERLSALPSSCTSRISLIETLLPRKTGLKERADLVVYCLPNMTPASADEENNMESCRSSVDARIAQYLAEAKEPEEEEVSSSDPAAIQRTLLYGRGISRNLHQLLRHNGICIRVEYATSRRHEWSPLSLLQVSFEEGSLDTEVGGISPKPWFRVLASVYYRSKVMEDVYQQTDNEQDKNGGYLITVLRAL
jgi:hypothetical protein